MPKSAWIIFPVCALLFLIGCGDDTGESAADTATGTDTVTGTDTGTGIDTETVTATDTGAGTGVDVATDTPEECMFPNTAKYCQNGGGPCGCSCNICTDCICPEDFPDTGTGTGAITGTDTGTDTSSDSSTSTDTVSDTVSDNDTLTGSGCIHPSSAKYCLDGSGPCGCDCYGVCIDCICPEDIAGTDSQ